MNKTNNKLTFNTNEDEHFIEYYNNNYKSDLLKANKNKNSKSKNKKFSNLKSIEKNHLNFNNKKNKYILDKNTQFKPVNNNVISVQANITVSELASKLGIKATEILKILFSKGKLLNINQDLDSSLLQLVSQELNLSIEDYSDKINQYNEYKDIRKNNEDDVNNNSESKIFKTRAPIISVLGHVNHGKTSLLAKLIKNDIIKTEIGQITQHIKAYETIIGLQNKKVIFIDTPGHEAFESVRQRVIQISDITLLLISADEGIEQQTIQIIKSIKETKSSIIAVITKVDKPNTQNNIHKIFQQLTEYGLIVEQLGGDIVALPISIFDDNSLKLLIEMILLTSEIKNLKFNPNDNAQGIVLETYLDKNKGHVAHLILQKGKLKTGDLILAGKTFGKIRSLFKHKIEKVAECEACSLVEVVGISELIKSGELLEKVETEKQAKYKIEALTTKANNTDFKKIIINNDLNLFEDKNIHNLNFIIKADVQGSIEAIIRSIKHNINNLKHNIQITIISADIGEVSLNDINLASIIKAEIITFNVKLSKYIRNTAQIKQVQIKSYNVIYDLLEDLNNLILSSVKETVNKLEFIGRAIVKRVFSLAKGKVAGCFVLKGKLINGYKIQVLRNNLIIYKGELDSLKFEKKDVEEISIGQECGIFCQDFQEWKENDIIECISS